MKRIPEIKFIPKKEPKPTSIPSTITKGRGAGQSKPEIIKEIPLKSSDIDVKQFKMFVPPHPEKRSAIIEEKWIEQKPPEEPPKRTPKKGYGWWY